jgi:hypothetical protein
VNIDGDAGASVDDYPEHPASKSFVEIHSSQFVTAP